jgi:aspartate 1-decarboxylase
MMRSMLKSKIHGAIVTQAGLRYEGSVSLFPEMMKPSDLLQGEPVDVVNFNNGARPGP